MVGLITIYRTLQRKLLIDSFSSPLYPEFIVRLCGFMDQQLSMSNFPVQEYLPYPFQPPPQPKPAPTVYDIIFPSDNEWGVPTLDSNLQVETRPTHFIKWGTVSRKHKWQGCIHFYTEDAKFTALYQGNRASQVVESGCDAIVETNYSQNPHMPRAIVLHGIFRKRWLARFWQTQGIRVLVDLNVEHEFFDLALLGVPKGWRSYANRVHRGSYEHLDTAYKLACQHADSVPLYIVYGGGKVIQQQCERNGWHWYPEDIRSKHHG